MYLILWSKHPLCTLHIASFNDWFLAPKYLCSSNLYCTSYSCRSIRCLLVPSHLVYRLNFIPEPSVCRIGSVCGFKHRLDMTLSSSHLENQTTASSKTNQTKNPNHAVLALGLSTICAGLQSQLFVCARLMSSGWTGVQGLGRFPGG